MDSASLANPLLGEKSSRRARCWDAIWNCIKLQNILPTEGKVLTVAGTGGMGKTALAAAFAERFAWMWTRGVSGYSFANEVNAANFRYALMRVLFGNEGAQQGASLSESQQREAILKAAREWSGLWLFDNYESIIQGIQENQPEAESIHRLIADLANGDADMLLTSREQPAGLRNERLFPDGNHALHGLGDEAGVELFFQHSVEGKGRRARSCGFCARRAARGRWTPAGDRAVGGGVRRERRADAGFPG